MTSTLGLLAAFIAFLSWGFGDFAIQRSVRRLGSFEALFFITALGAVVLFPFVRNDVSSVPASTWFWLLLLTVFVTLVTAILEFEAFRVGKLSVIEPIMSFELVVTAAIGVAVLGERPTMLQGILGLAVFCGVALTVLHREPRRWWSFWKKQGILERGALLGMVGMVLMALTNVLTGLSSRETSPLFAIWFIHTGLAVVSFIILCIRKNLGDVFSRARVFWKLVLAESLLDNLAWIAYAAAVTVLPISITVAMTESYIALASLLGLVFNKERLERHQSAGMVLALAAAVMLAFTTSGG